MVDRVVGNLLRPRVDRAVPVVAILVDLVAIAVGVEQVLSVTVLIDSVVGNLVSSRMDGGVRVIAVVVAVAVRITVQTGRVDAILDRVFGAGKTGIPPLWAVLPPRNDQLMRVLGVERRVGVGDRGTQLT